MGIIKLTKLITKLMLIVSGFSVLLGGTSFIMRIGQEKRPDSWRILILGAVGICLAFFTSVFGVPYLEKTEAEIAT